MKKPHIFYQQSSHTTINWTTNFTHIVVASNHKLLICSWFISIKTNK